MNLINLERNKRRRYTSVLLSLLAFFIFTCKESESKKGSTDQIEKRSLPYELRMTLVHNPNAFTQGLVYYKDKMIESTGGDSSWIAEFNVTSDKYVKKVLLNQKHFGEGITVLNNKVFQLTWKSNIGFIYDVNTYKKIGEFRYNFEGWGITTDKQHLIISDGTDKLHYFDTLKLTEVLTKSILHNKRKALHLNELEYIDGFIYANKWRTNLILKINPNNSEVVKEFDLGDLVRGIERSNPKADVLNGIAYNPLTKDVFITGKFWPFMYVVRFND